MSDKAWQLNFQPLMASHVAEILTWRYEPPYDIYNMGADTDDPVGLAEAIDYFTPAGIPFSGDAAPAGG
ncbi:hypothetical protein [Candidatus Leptofilum sp.]|uniref:hypothetical protein n=1 Tax=Candidatus Leptofilum sp. TaxID=3241576 RepID=UPI003B5CB763